MAQQTQVSHETQVIRNLQERLTHSYQGRRAPHEVAAVVEQTFHRFDQAPIRDFIPLLVEHLARDTLGRA